MTILIAGDFLSRKDEEAGGPFRDGRGKMFKAMLRQCGIEPRECTFTNVFLRTPPGRFSPLAFCGPKNSGAPNVKYFAKGNYIRAEHFPEVEQFWRRVNHTAPNLVLACGDLALWATLPGNNSINFARGRIAAGNAAINGIKVLPTYSPSQVIADNSLKFTLLCDLEKARREAQFPELRRPRRLIHIPTTLEDAEDFFNQWLAPAPWISCDIETKQDTITCIGFAPDPERALVIPFYSQGRPDGNYWRTKREEYLAWSFVRRVLALPTTLVHGQNFQYDMQYLLRRMGIPCPRFGGDTMLLHHCLQPEMRKGLGYLASIYTDEPAWKGMHKVSASDKTAKKEDQ